MEPEDTTHVVVYTHSGTHDISEDEDPFIYGNVADNSTSYDQGTPLELTNDLFDQLMLRWMVLPKTYLLRRCCNQLAQ